MVSLALWMTDSSVEVEEKEEEKEEGRVTAL